MKTKQGKMNRAQIFNELRNRKQASEKKMKDVKRQSVEPTIEEIEAMEVRRDLDRM